MTQTIEQLTARVRELEEDDETYAKKDKANYELRQKLAIFESAVEHVTEEGKTKRSFSVSEGWAMVHKERLIDLECAEEQLAACQAREQQLREALRKIADLRNLGKIEPEVVAFEALTLQQDTTALEALIAKAGEVMRERCESTLETIGAEDNCYGGAHAIRALPSVTLEDLK